MNTAAEKPLLGTELICKKFPGSRVSANNGISFSVAENEIHAVVGENGSGKSTLMHIISGLVKPDSGSVYYRGVETVFNSPYDAITAGIGMIHQVPGIVPGFSALENILIGREGKWYLKTDMKKAHADIEKISSEYGLDINLAGTPETTEAKQVTVLLALIYRGADVIIFDEPTASLSDDESAGFLRIMKTLREKGKTVIFVTHKIAAALSAAERITVLSRGEKKGTFFTSETSVDEIAGLIAGENYFRKSGPERGVKDFGADKTVFEAREVTLPGKKVTDEGKISFSVAEGEVLSFTGIRENNLDLLENLLSGFYQPAGGKLYFLGKDITAASIRTMRRSGIKYIPSDRLGRGTSLTTSVENNLAFTHISDFSDRGFINAGRIRDFFNTGINAFNISAAPGQPLWQLSGGNIQKVILFREIHKAKKLLIFCEPAWNLDIVSREMIYTTITELAERGTSIIVITTDIEEAVEISDRVAVMYQGKIAGFLVGEDINSHNISRMMLGLDNPKGRKQGP